MDNQLKELVTEAHNQWIGKVETLDQEILVNNLTATRQIQVELRSINRKLELIIILLGIVAIVLTFK